MHAGTRKVVHTHKYSLKLTLNESLFQKADLLKAKELIPRVEHFSLKTQQDLDLFYVETAAEPLWAGLK